MKYFIYCPKCEAKCPGGDSVTCPNCGSQVDGKIRAGITLRTPRFLNCRIEVVYIADTDNERAARKDGFTEPTHFVDPEYMVLGRSLGHNHMDFALVKK